MTNKINLINEYINSERNRLETKLNKETNDKTKTYMMGRLEALNLLTHYIKNI